MSSGIAGEAPYLEVAERAARTKARTRDLRHLEAQAANVGPLGRTLLGLPQRIKLKLEKSDVAAPGTLRAAVVNPEPGGGTSDTIEIPVDANDVPTVPQ
jgi:hypothetical protein